MNALPLRNEAIGEENARKTGYFGVEGRLRIVGLLGWLIVGLFLAVTDGILSKQDKKGD